MHTPSQMFSPPTLPCPLPSSTHSARNYWLQTRDILRGPDHVRYQKNGRQKEIYQRKNQGFWYINQGSDINREAKSDRHILEDSSALLYQNWVIL